MFAMLLAAVWRLAMLALSAVLPRVTSSVSAAVAAAGSAYLYCDEPRRFH